MAAKKDLTTTSNIENRIEATYRAISGKINASFRFREANHFEPVLEGESLYLAPLNKEFTGNQLNAIRGMVDSAAFFLKYHDPIIHEDNQPTSHEALQIFNFAEKARIDALGAKELNGVSQNINDSITQRFLNYHYDQVGLLNTVPLNEIIYLAIWQRLTGHKLPDVTMPVMNRWGRSIITKIRENLINLDQYINDQQGFANQIKLILQSIESLSSTSEKPKDKKQNKPSDSNQTPQQNEDNREDHKINQVASPTSMPRMYLRDKTDKSADVKEKHSEEAPLENYKPNLEQYKLSKSAPYRIFTTEFDQIIKAEDLCSIHDLLNARKQLDSKLAKLGKTHKKNASRFLRQLLSQQKRSWQFNLEEGFLDSGRLALKIADPNYFLIYKQEHEITNIDTVVTLLLDNSGSMRGRPITVAAMSAEILAKTLESCGIKVEILGFTTVEWKGGRSREKWLNHDSPSGPGRLNDLRHIIYKSADTPWRKARKNIGLMLKEGILKENIDGEAILWAFHRLLARPEKRRIIMVISDGAPVDDSTISANGSAYLDQHLRDVIKMIENQTDVELVAVGIGHDVTRYYSHAVIIREIDELSNVMFQELSNIFELNKAS